MIIDRINELYAGQLFSRETQLAARERIQWICRQVQGDKVLDIGCSQGITCLLLGREGFNCTGVDYKQAAIDYALEELSKEEEITRKRVKFQVVDATKLPFDDNTFDTVILGELLEHLTHPLKVLKEARRVLRDSGIAIISVPFGLNPDPDHKRTYYPISFLSDVRQFFRTEVLDTFQNYILYCGKKDKSYDIKKVAEEEVLREYLELQKKVEERCLVKEQALYDVTNKYTEQTKKLNEQMQSLTQSNKELKIALEEKEKYLSNALQRKDEELQKTIIERQKEFEAKLNEKDKEAAFKLEAKEKEKNKLKDELDSKAKLHESDLLKIEELQKMLNEKDSELNSLRSDLDLKEKQLEMNSLSIEELQNALNEKTEEISGLRADLEHRERQHEENLERIKELHVAMLNKKERELNESLIKKLDETKSTLHEQAKQLKKAFEEKEELTRQLKAKDPQWRSILSSQEELFKHAWKWRIGSIFVDGYILARDFVTHPVDFTKESSRRFREYYYTINPGALPEVKKEQQMKKDLAKSARTSAPASSPQPKKHSDFKPAAVISITLGCVLDEFTTACFKPESNLLTFRPDNWREVLEANQPNGIFVESAWRGNDGAWQYRVAKYSKNMGDELLHLLTWAREKKIPSFFWNKEDPTHFERFIEKAKLFDHVFTTDADCIPGYKKQVGHDRVFALPFAAQPQIHNPILDHSREHAICFAGTYYAMFPERCQDMEIILKPALDFGLHIYDRQHGLSGPEAAQYRFPDIYQPAIKGRLDYKDMLAAYKNYKVFLNVNSVKNSPTMFSRRVFELLACGTPVITTYSKGIEEILGSDLVLITESEKDTRRYLEKLIHDDSYWSALSVKGIRKVMEEHTYSQRMKFISDCAGMNYSVPPLPSFTVISIVESDKDIDALRDSLARQKYRNFDVVLLTGKDLGAALQRTRNALPDIEIKNYTLASNAVYNDALKACQGEFVAVFDCKDYYGANYLRDYALSARYALTSYIGKNAYYFFRKDELKASGDEFRFVAEVPTATLAIKKEIIDPNYFSTLLGNTQFQTGESKILSLDRFNYVKSAPDGDLPDDKKKSIEV